MAALSLAKLTDRVLYWQRVLAPLGIGHWEVKVSYVTKPDDHNGDEAGATVDCENHYDSCYMQFNRGYVSSNPDRLDLNIVHEWLHVARRDLDEAVDDVIFKHVPSHATASVNSRINHESEGDIERTARLIIALHTEVVLDWP